MELFKVSESSGSSVTVKAATTFKPLLLIKNGCHAYPAVNAAGQVSTGLQQADATGAACSGSSMGSQVYGRSAWYGRVWGIMYAWYFPDVKPEWEHVVVWINNPDVTDQTIRGASMTNSTGGYFSQVPPDAMKVEGGKNVKIRYKNNGLKPTTKKGEVQNLVMWDQLTPAAQKALNDDKSFGGVQVPINDNYFLLNLGKAWPFEKKH
ncbi:Necrosis inducing protein NPP1 [Phytophthora megakarya]|uniref:Necrosis inducing protein NPP1 n=1 Tax=Phytophthora megakarya TaxID=4795 RepID=A0A225UYJ0_9STRA|nr:Necrosis inducing protein NPP1 [Phytophthora megakarya]